MLKTLIRQIDEKFKELGLSYSAVEKKLGFGNGAIKRFSTSSPSIEKVIQLANFLNVSLDWLVYGESKSVQLTKNELEFLKILRTLDSNTDQLRLLGYVEGYIKGISIQELEIPPEQETANTTNKSVI